MNNEGCIFLLFGASGAGKTTLLEFIKNEPHVTIHKKDTTRKPRQSENLQHLLELRFV